MTDFNKQINRVKQYHSVHNIFISIWDAAAPLCWAPGLMLASDIRRRTTHISGRTLLNANSVPDSCFITALCLLPQTRQCEQCGPQVANLCSLTSTSVTLSSKNNFFSLVFSHVMTQLCYHFLFAKIKKRSSFCPSTPSEFTDFSMWIVSFSEAQI